MNIPRSLHFIGIGGIGMSAIAQVWHAQGNPVTGSDAHASASVQRLMGLGVPVSVGHAAANLGAAEAVVRSTAVAQDNPELEEARRRGLPVFHRSEVLGALMAQKRSIAVSGTHGKTTTSAMVASILLEAEVDPTIILGGELPHLGGNARAGEGPYLVAEADESDKSIRNLTAEVVILTNLEGDHLEHYRDLDEIIDVMAEFIGRLPAGAALVACGDDAGVKKLLARVDLPRLTYGFGPGVDVPITDAHLTAGGSIFTVEGARYALQVPGRHNIANATAALLAARAMGVGPEALMTGLADFTGVKRRFQHVGTVGGVTVIDDYAHHPSEIRATLEAARLLNRPLHAVFQPHRHSRLEALLDDFSQAFGTVDSVTILDTYAAGESPRAVTAATLVDLVRVRTPGLTVTHTPTAPQAVSHLVATAKPGDLVLLLGAGDIYQMASPILQALEARLNLSAQSA